MATFIMTTRLSHAALTDPGSIQDLSVLIADKVKRACPTVIWWSNYVVLGPADYLDIFTAPDIETATKVATIIRSFGHATTEIWPAIEWDGFKALLGDLEAADGAPSLPGRTQ